MKRRVLEVKHSSEPWRADEEWDRIRRGWCFGRREFRVEMLDRIEGVLQGKQSASHDGDALRDYGQRDAERLIKKGLQLLSVSSEELAGMKKRDLKKQVLAWLLKKNTRVPNAWVASQLHMGHPSNLPLFVKNIENSEDPTVRQWKRALENT